MTEERGHDDARSRRPSTSGSALLIDGSSRELRRERGLTQEQLAERGFIPRTYLASIESGKRHVAIVNVVYLARALGALPRDLFRRLTKSCSSVCRGTSATPRGHDARSDSDRRSTADLIHPLVPQAGRFATESPKEPLHKSSS
ncbi:MAG TPA: helix-turn-helix domain-containing protein [Thermoanaerobaculia bacterium]|nr:helix-turn-helix domain-containing protein [Thermoanaerobaculia bacterium]